MILETVPKRLIDKNSIFILDENIQPSEYEKKSSKYINMRQIRKPGTPDWVLLEEAKEHNGVIITMDKGFVLRAIIEFHDIIYQTPWGDRYYIDGRNTRLIKQGCQSKKHSETNKEKRAQKIARCIPATLSLDGFDVIYCL